MNVHFDARGKKFGLPARSVGGQEHFEHCDTFPRDRPDMERNDRILSGLP